MKSHAWALGDTALPFYAALIRRHGRKAMPRHARILWSRIMGEAVLGYAWRAITARSVVHVTASEARLVEGSLFGPAYSIDRFLGRAKIDVHNIVPENGGVTFLVEVHWDDWLTICTDITVFDELPQRYTIAW
jgi:hypothetical protein